MGINTGWGGGGGASSFSQLTGTLANAQIPDTEIAVGKLNATGTPGSGNYLRGDGSWSTPTGATQSHLSYKGFAAKGSTNTNVARWSTQIATAGSDLSMVQSATNGDYISVATAGYYTITMGAYSSGIHDYQIHVGSSVDNSVLYSATHYRSGHTSTNGYLFSFTWTGYIAANDRIWITSGGLPTNTDPLNNFFSVTRIS